MPTIITRSRQLRSERGVAVFGPISNVVARRDHLFTSSRGLDDPEDRGRPRRDPRRVLPADLSRLEERAAAVRDAEARHCGR